MIWDATLMWCHMRLRFQTQSVHLNLLINVWWDVHIMVIYKQLLCHDHNSLTQNKQYHSVWYAVSSANYVYKSYPNACLDHISNKMCCCQYFMELRQGQVTAFKPMSYCSYPFWHFLKHPGHTILKYMFVNAKSITILCLRQLLTN